MKEQTRIFLNYANKAADKIRKVHQVVSGGECVPECGSLLGDAYYLIADMIQSYLTTAGMKVMDDDDFNDMTTKIMFAKTDGEMEDIIRKYFEN